jgi:alkylated DNA repair dioxygenase AlkB
VKRTRLPDDAWIDYTPQWVPPTRAQSLKAELIETLAWEQRPIVVFGRSILQPRFICWAGEIPYKYSGQVLEERPLEGLLADLNAQVSAAVGIPFNHVLLNRYRNGADHMGWHADDERELGRDPVIAAISLGAKRRFYLHRKKNKGQKRRFKLGDGSLLVMGGTCQHTWRHCVPKMAGLEGERINLTFRYLHGPPGWRSSPRSSRA